MTTFGALDVPYAAPSLSDSGAPVSGATLLINIAGGSTAANLFSDHLGANSLGNPLTANAAGRYINTSGGVTAIWVDTSQAYDCILTYPNGESFTFPNMYALGAGLNTSGFAPINSPLFTGNPRGPTPALNDNSISLATTAFVAGQGFAPLASPGFSGTPTAPTAAASTNSTQIATTAFVQAALGTVSAGTGKLQFGKTLLQWGTQAVVSSSGSVTLPTAYANTGYTILMTPSITGGSGGLIANVGLSSITTSGFSINGSQAGSGSPVSFTCMWLTAGQVP